MGNSGSGHQQQATLVEGPPHSWAHSFPRTTSFKVLPDRIPGQRLRLTDNGAILHNGGTISGRKPYSLEPPMQEHRNGGFQNGQDYRRMLYGSEPDLRFTRDTKPQNYMPTSNQTYYNNNNDNSVKARIGRSRKKYKAPPAPHNNSADSSSPDSYHRWETSADSSDVTTPSRRSRLFKTRAETKRPSIDNANSNKYLPPNSYSQMYKGQVPGPLQRSLSSPQFQDELTAKLRERAIREPPVGKAADSPRDSPVLRSRENISQKKPALKLHNSEIKKANGKAHNVPEKLPPKNGLKANNVNHSSSNAYRSRPPKEPSKKSEIENRSHAKGPVQNGHTEKIPHRKVAEKKESEKKKATAEKSTPVKKFYFGMESDTKTEPQVNGDTNEVVDKFAAAIRKSAPVVSNTSPSESFSSEPTNDDSSAGISLKLRPTLPRKQLDIPRFSPTAAWRLLSALESPVHSEEDDLMLIEEQIPHPHAGHQLTDKSGDSGISGDASPQHQDSTHNSQVAWTPQQDLEETSSDGGLESAPVSPESIGTAKFSPRFSLSLPRDERVPTYSYSDKIPSEILPPSSSFQNLKKLKRSVSGALGKNKEVAVSSLDENWLLSRSVPNLFHNSYANRWSDSSPSSGDQDDDPACSVGKPPSFSYLANGGHIMYLPEYKNTKQQRERKIPSLTQMSKSCEDLTRHQVEKSNYSMNASGNATTNHNNSSNNNRSKSNRKFTFQSTIRQIERKRIAEKLSKEAEEKEKRRLRELEAMKKVEEEFQRKREREKADIRHQLRLYNLTEGGREQPDGAVIPPPPPSTQVLSEYRQPRRDYRDYTPMRSDMDSISHSDAGIKKETVHPEVVYKMPKNAQVYVTPHHSNSGNGSSFHSRVDSPKSMSSDNYRKDFAQGALPRSVASSDSELSQPNTRPTSRTKQRSRSPSPSNDDEANEFENHVTNSILINGKHLDESSNVSAHVEEYFGIEIPDSNLARLQREDASLKNTNHELVGNRIAPQPYNRNKTYKPVLFKPFSDKIAQVTS